ncbi:heavy metal translocating P-type ATPase [Schaalia sp. Marseille-Q2122]|uniref:heavy metal translocating P-type ATPase n=1 Tax=Schaalia sp. Marseille-Q2122 TaxID=2736604 RepID=UPI00158F5086|nr:heavy metal translocating P-type ATPase [Schaalia sp. Marseille-Q2122]
MYRLRLLVSLPLSAVVMVLSMFPPLQFPGWQWLVAALSLPVVTWGAWPFHQAALRTARHGSTTMDTLVSLGVTASTLWSLWALFFGGAGHIGMTMQMSFIPAANHGHADIYFEGACMIVVFLLIGRTIEARTRLAAGDALRSLLEMSAKEAVLLTTDEAGARVERRVPTAQLQVGDVVLVRPGEKVPTDGVVIEGASAVDSSLMTGESVPVDVTVGDEVIGGVMNTWGSLTLRATAVGEDTALAHIGQMVASAQADKAQVQRLADRVSGVFVPAVLALSAATFVGWLIAGGSTQAAMTAAVAVLVVACPCALGLATPTALLVGSGRAAQLGIVLRSAQVLESTRRVDTMIFDKTGTLTDGRMGVVDAAFEGASEPSLWAKAASVEALSEHPVGAAIVAAAGEKNIPPVPVEAFTAFAGNGVSAVIGSERVVLGKPSWMSALGVEISPEISTFQAEHEAAGATVVMMVSVPASAVAPGTAGADALLPDAPQSGAPLPDSPLPDTPVPNTDASRHLLPALASPEAPATPSAPELPTLAFPQIELKVEGMTCASCVRRVEKKLAKLEGVSASVNLATESALVTLDREWDPQAIADVVDAAGFHATILGLREAPARQAAMQAAPQAPTWDPHSLTQAKARVSAAFAVKDALKPDARQAIAQVRDLGITPVLLTGDNERAARAVASELGIERVHAQVTPADKHDLVRELHSQGATVAMVGDGVNDAAALAQADLGMAMGSGTDVAQDVADIVLTTSRVSAAPLAVRISKKTLRIIKENLFWAFGYNVAMLPLAVMGLLNPMIAAAAMSMSSVCVVGNSLRLRRIRPDA